MDAKTDRPPVLDVGFDDRVAPPKLLLFAVQHLLTLSAIWVFPVLIGITLGLATGDVTHMIQASFLLAGIVTVLQSSRIVRLPIVQGPTAAFFAALLAAGAAYGLDAAFGSMVVAGLVFLLLTIPIGRLGVLIHFLRFATDPLVYGTICIIIGAQLATLGLPGWFGSEGQPGYGWDLFWIGLATLLTVVACLLFGGRTLIRRAAVIIGMVVGSVLAAATGLWSMPDLTGVSFIGPPTFLPFGFAVAWPAVLLMLLAFLESSAEAVGMYTLVSRWGGTELSRERINRGLFTEYAGSVVGAPVRRGRHRLVPGERGHRPGDPRRQPLRDDDRRVHRDRAGVPAGVQRLRRRPARSRPGRRVDGAVRHHRDERRADDEHGRVGRAQPDRRRHRLHPRPRWSVAARGDGRDHAGLGPGAGHDPDDVRRGAADRAQRDRQLRPAPLAGPPMITLHLNHQQHAFLRSVGDIGDLVREALRNAPAHEPSASVFSARSKPVSRTDVAAHLLEPGTGKAVEVRAGHVVRITQIEGHQCVDLNVFALRDRRERLHVGRTRGLQGRHPGPGDVLWSNAPWERPIMAIIGGTATTDTQFPFCSRLIYRAFFGQADRTNCQEIQNEAQREYGLDPWDIHESLNLFMHTATGPDGEPVIRRNVARPGDFIELVALIDLLVVPNVCGDDLTNCSNFGLRPVEVTVEEGRPADAEQAGHARDRSVVLGLPEPRSIAGARPLRRDPAYVAAFPYLPLRPADVRVEVSPQLLDRFHRARNTDLYGDDEAAALRDLTMSWAIERSGAFTGND